MGSCVAKYTYNTPSIEVLVIVLINYLLLAFYWPMRTYLLQLLNFLVHQPWCMMNSSICYKNLPNLYWQSLIFIDTFPVWIASDFSFSMPISSQSNHHYWLWFQGFTPIKFCTLEWLSTPHCCSEKLSLAIVIVDVSITFKVNQPIEQTPTSL